MSALRPPALVYLAGPMTGLPRYGFDAFESAREALRADGFEVMCPAEEDIAAGFDPDQPGTAGPLWEYMARDLPMICRAAALVLLPGWRGSRGCRIETSVAMALGIPLYEWPTLEEPSIAHEAQALVYGDRHTSYGHPLDDFAKTAGLWTAHLRARGLLAPGAELAAEDVPWMMIDVKRSRQLNRPGRDNLVDAIGYVLTLDRVIRERERRAAK